ncbi:MAG: DNA helicase Rep [Pseudomonadales bacterium]|nr:DNA helicase Rep [Pseudomonadales bacterium]
MSSSSTPTPKFSLNPEQLKAVQYVDGPCLVLAGAGSGKTRVITEKIAYLIKECDIAAHHITAVTFTNKAAREMKERVSKQLDKKARRGLTISTFHTLGLKIIRSEQPMLGLSDGFSIFDSHDSGQLIRELMLASVEEAEDATDRVKFHISNWKNNLISCDHALSHAADKEEQLSARVYVEYERSLRAYNAVDFDDLIMLPARLFAAEPAVLAKWQSRIRYLLVDEYQDTNQSQYQMVKYLVGQRAAFTVVGDDDQSIYSWRGAQPENLALLAEDFPSLELIKLEQNYRSSSLILKAANAVIDNNPHVFDKRLWSQLEHGESIRALRCASEDAEAERVATDIFNHHLQHKRPFSDYAILYRGNFQSRLIETKLKTLQVPYKISGGSSFFGKTEIRDILYYLRVIINPDDDNAFLRIINVPRREIGPRTLEKLSAYAQQREKSLLAASGEIGLRHHLPERVIEKLEVFSRWMTKLQQRCVQEDPMKAIRQMIDDIHYETWCYEQSSNPRAAEKKMENIGQLLNSINSMLEKNEDSDLSDVIRKLVLLDMLDEKQQEDDDDRVQLMTLHASKGLEFPHVFIMGMEEELLPHRTSLEEDSVEEERRLFYVGITRAQRELTLTLSARRRQYGEVSECTPSRFLDELPRNDVEWEGWDQQRSEEETKAVASAHISNLRAILDK